MKRKYNEMFKLKEMLEKENIPFDWTENWGYSEKTLKEMSTISPDLVERYQICYPCSGEGRKLSAIQGFGTYGAEHDLIEIMGLLTPEEELDDKVVGYLTAKNVFERIKTDYEGRIKIMKKIMVVDEDTLEMKEIIKEDDVTDEELDTFANILRTALNCEPEEFYQKYREMKKAEDEFKKLYEPFKNNLIKIHEEKSNLPKSVVIGGVKLTYVSPSKRSTIDNKKLKEEEPEIAKKFTKISNVKSTIRLEDV